MIAEIGSLVLWPSRQSYLLCLTLSPVCVCAECDRWRSVWAVQLHGPPQAEVLLKSWTVHHLRSQRKWRTSAHVMPSRTLVFCTCTNTLTHKNCHLQQLTCWDCGGNQQHTCSAVLTWRGGGAFMVSWREVGRTHFSKSSSVGAQICPLGPDLFVRPINTIILIIIYGEYLPCGFHS